ncbi:hypothetical protein OKW30_005121 [Paraburkholderia sp. Clong3]|uniref:hypothetical protein n=1 Tax=unclassified Paraburkholderia TaxID=2615204 RepID=UPI00161D0D30|nr:hypothetical protein [Paraburkholderia sp. CI2]MBB5470605.1 hypothetical protein [Paraburkholderia sp. CI2]
MLAVKATWFRPACGYAAATVCVALAAWGGASPPPTLGIMRALDQTERDTQLPLERFAIKAGNVAASSSLAPRPQRQQPQQTAQPSRPNRRISEYLRGRAIKADTSQRESGAHGYYRKIDNWKNWT